jgi:hypothetical protein
MELNEKQIRESEKQIGEITLQIKEIKKLEQRNSRNGNR